MNKISTLKTSAGDCPDGQILKRLSAFLQSFVFPVLLTGILLFVSTADFAQTAGDYRSAVAAVSWNNPAHWQKYSGGIWAAAPDYPGQNACSSCTVTIQNGHTVTTNISPANSIGNLVVGGGTSGVLTLGTYALSVTGNLTVNAGATINLATGTFTVGGTTTTSGTISDLSNTGVVTFTGLVMKNAGTWTSTVVTTASNLVFSGGFTNASGAFNAGAATIGDNQTLTGNVVMTFGSGVTVLGNGDLNIAGTASAGVTFNGTGINYAVRNLNLTGLLTVGTTGNLTVTGTTSITGTGAFIDNNNAGVTSFAGLVTHSSTGTFTSTIVTTPGNMVFSSGFTNTSGTFSAGAATVGDNQTLTGTVNMAFANGLTVLGNGDLNIAGTTVTGVSFNGTAINYAVRNLTLTGLLTVGTTGNLTVTGNTSITGSGAFTDNNNTGITSFAGTVTHNSAGGWTSTTVTTPANIVFTQGFTNTAGYFFAGGATVGDNQTLTGTVNMTFTNGLTVLGNKDLNIAGTTTQGVSFNGTGINYTVRNLNLTGRLTVGTSGNLTVTGTTSMTGTGSFNDINNSGVTSFAGTVTHNSTGVWASTLVTTPTNMVFSSGFTNTLGSFTAGAASLPSDQTLDGNIIMYFYSTVTVGGAGNLTITGAGGVRFGGTSINIIIPGNLTLTGKLNVATSGNFTVTGTTNITGAGDFADNQNTGTTTFTGLVTHNSTGRWVSTGVITASHMIFTNGFTNTAGTFSAGAATIGDNKTLTGTVNMSFNRGVTVLGNADITIAGTATTGVTFGGSLINYSVRNLNITGQLTTSTSGNLTVTGTCNVSSTGKFLDNNSIGTTTFSGMVTVGSTATFVATSVSTVGRLNFGGGITQNNTTALAFNVGSIRTTATQTWSGAGDIRTAGALDVNSGTLTNSLTGTVISVGTLTGTTFVQSANAKLALGSTTPLTITTLTSTANNNTVTYNGASCTMRSQTYYHLTVAGSGTKTISTTDITVNGNLTISAGAISNTANNRNIILAGNWINNVSTTAFVAGTGTVTFGGTAAQTLGGTFATTFKNLTLNNAAGITQAVNTTISGVLTLTSGIITTGSYSVYINSAGSVSRTSGHIFGNEQRNIATGAGVARTYDIGDATNYTPVTLTFSSVSVAGNVTVKSTGTEHPLLVSALLNGSLSVNRYWTITNSGTVFTNYSSVFNFVAGDKDAGINTANMSAGINSGSWTYPTVGTKTSTSTQVTGMTVFGTVALAEALACLTPTVVVHDPAPFCSPATVDLTAAAVTAGSTSGLTFTYWTDSMATISLSSPSAVAVGGTYYIKGTVAGGCSDVAPVLVTRNNPTGVISGATTICTGSSASLNIAVTGTGPWSGTLSDGTAYSGSTDTISVTVSPVVNTTYSIATLLDAGCSAQAGDLSGSALVTISALPTAANAGPDQSLCGVAAILAANTPVTGTGSWSVVSGTGGSFSDITNPASSFSGTAGVVYVLRWTITNAPCAGSTDDVTIDFTSGIWTGTVDADWNNVANWCAGSVPAGTIDLVLPAGLAHYPEIAEDIIINDLTIAAGASLTVTGTGSLTISGAYTNSGTLTNSGAIILNGTVSQNFPGATATIAAMNNLEIDNADGVIIDQSFSISGTFTSTTGTINLMDKIITLKSDAAGTAMMAPVGGDFDYSGGGKFNVQCYVPARRAWHLMTAPLTNTSSIYDTWQNAGVFTPGVGTLVSGVAGSYGMDSITNSSLKLWDVATQTLVPVTTTATNVSPGSAGSADNTGYFIFVRGDRNPANFSTGNTNATTLNSQGQLQTGPQTYTAGSTAGNYTLIGNPYASPIDFANIARTNLLKRFYVWDATLNRVGGYVMMDDLDDDGVFSNSVAGSLQTNELLSQQAFFVETIASGPASLTINESDKSDGSTYVIARIRSVRKSMSINLNLLDTDSTILADGVKAEYDDLFSNQVTSEDALKFGNVNETFSLVRASKALALERREIIQTADTLFLKITKTTTRRYQFRFKPSAMESFGMTAVLKDLFLGTETPVDLTDSTNVDFEVTSNPASSGASRFMLIFRPMTVLAVNFTSVKASEKGGVIAVDWKVENETGIFKYDIEKSTDGINFSRMATSLVPLIVHSNEYSTLDANPAAGNNYYRIKSIGNAGEIKYSQVVKVSTGKHKSGIAVYPNPVKDNSISIQFSNKPAGIYAVSLINSTGQVVYTDELNVTGNNAAQALVIKQVLTKGVYHLEVNGPAETRMQQQIIVE